MTPHLPRRDNTDECFLLWLAGVLAVLGCALKILLRP